MTTMRQGPIPVRTRSLIGALVVFHMLSSRHTQVKSFFKALLLGRCTHLLTLLSEVQPIRRFMCKIHPQKVESGA